MKFRTFKVAACTTFLALFALAVMCPRQLWSRAIQQPAPPAKSAQKGFATPEQAAAALVEAAKNYNVPVLLQILGPDSKDLVTSEDSVSDKNRSIEFAKLAGEKQSISLDPKDGTRATLLVGPEDWPFPIPIRKQNGEWYFDSKAGRQNILYRRIGQNELDAIKICRGYVEAQDDYASEKHDGSELNQYAQRIVSTPGKQDGLAWQNADGTWGGPVGETVAKALAEGYAPNQPPFHGYYFKILKGQGPDAPLGAMNFVIEGAMIG
ncbi:MAG: DUF2950 family protein, partial [Acidobacteriaceae bacterium]|nr:DUF2950 family protein [Acidobacteriaceae bacterium]